MSCNLCPRKCKIDRTKGEKGFCGMDNRIKIARAALHYWEEPCISGTNGSGTVFFSGCNLRCVYCQNYKISTCLKGRYVTAAELSEIFIDLQDMGANNINLVTPTHFASEITKALIMAKENGLKIPIVYNCGGYEDLPAIPKELIDIYLVDFKYFDNKYAIKYSSAPNYKETAQKAVAEMVKRVGKPKFNKNRIMEKGVIVRHLMLPGLLFDSKKILDYLHTTYKDKIWISIMNQYTPLDHVKKFPELNRCVPKEHYDALIDYAAEIGITNAFIQEGGTVGESYIPDFYDE